MDKKVSFLFLISMSPLLGLINGRLVDVGGYKLHIHDTGSGGPTVILDACLGGNHLYWGLVQPEVEKFTRVCSYDRAGLGLSDESSLERTSENIAKELHTLLHAGGVSGPYILVGHSSGGINMRMYANMYPEDVHGVILIDASHENQLETFEKIDVQFKPNLVVRLKTWAVENKISRYCANMLRSWHILAPEINTMIPVPLRAAITPLEQSSKAERAGAGEWKSFKTSMQQLKNSQNQILEKPLIIVTGSKSFVERCPDKAREQMLEYDKVWTGFQKDFLKNSHKSMQIFAKKSGHFVLFDEPEIVVEAIRTMVDQFKQNKS